MSPITASEVETAAGIAGSVAAAVLPGSNVALVVAALEALITQVAGLVQAAKLDPATEASLLARIATAQAAVPTDPF
jgi:hypothetical protein